jgi:hypothetical protein
MKTTKEVRELFELMQSPVKEEFLEWLDLMESFVHIEFGKGGRPISYIKGNGPNKYK